MITCTEIRSRSNECPLFRKRALRDAVICIGWIRLVSVVCYLTLYFLVYANSKGQVADAIELMTLLCIPPQILLGTLLFYGVLEDKIIALELSLWLCLLIASYNLVLGVMGCVFFIRTGHLTMHFLLAVAFAMLALSLFTVLCHDILIIHSYKEAFLPNNPTNPPVQNNPTRPAAVTWSNA